MASKTVRQFEVTLVVETDGAELPDYNRLRISLGPLQQDVIVRTGGVSVRRAWCVAVTEA